MSDHQETLNKIESILRALGGRMDVANAQQASLTELGLDSLKTMDLILSIEEAFQIQIPDEKLNSKYLNSINAITELVVSLQK